MAQLGGGAGGTGGPLSHVLPGIGYGPTSGSHESQPGLPLCAGREALHLRARRRVSNCAQELRRIAGVHQLQYTRSSHDVRLVIPSHGFGCGTAVV